MEIYILGFLFIELILYSLSRSAASLFLIHVLIATIIFLFITPFLIGNWSIIYIVGILVTGTFTSLVKRRSNFEASHIKKEDATKIINELELSNKIYNQIDKRIILKESLKDLEESLQENLITKEEYEIKRNELLNKY